MKPIDRNYYLERAEQELKRGETAATRQAADAHFELAGRYFDLAYGDASSGETLSAPSGQIAA